MKLFNKYAEQPTTFSAASCAVGFDHNGCALVHVALAEGPSVTFTMASHEVADLIKLLAVTIDQEYKVGIEYLRDKE